MPHLGHLPGLSLCTSVSIGHVYSARKADLLWAVVSALLLSDCSFPAELQEKIIAVADITVSIRIFFIVFNLIKLETGNGNLNPCWYCTQAKNNSIKSNSYYTVG